MPISTNPQTTITVTGAVSATAIEALGQILETLGLPEEKFVGMCVEAAALEWRARGRLTLPLRLSSAAH